MPITQVGAFQSGAVANGADVTLTFDVPPIGNDVVIICGGHRSAGSIGPAAADGYEVIDAQTGADPRFGIWWKRMGATPDTTVTGRGNGQATDAVAYCSLVLRGVNLASGLDVPGASSSASADPAAIATVTDGVAVVVATGRSNSATALGTLPGVYTETAVLGTDTNRMSAGIGFAVFAAAGTIDPPQWSSGNVINELSFTVAFRPVTPGPLRPSRIRPAAFSPGLRR